jgi:phosphoribosyl 1,2-cyclic phosphodiesterase
VEVRFWGVRGSIPTPGALTQGWGGNTACLEVRHGDLQPLVFDCGTGARGLGFKLVGQPGRELDLLFTHLHMDHVFGFPFFIPIYTPGYQVRVTVPAYSEDEAREKIARYLNGIYHPTRLRDLPAQVTFHAIRPGREFQRGGYTLSGLALNHPGGSVGYRITAEGKSICYITDTAPFARPGEGLCAGAAPPPAERKMIDFLRDADVVVYDTMYDLNEYLEKMTWGHSYPEYAWELCKEAGVKKLVLFHHAPDASDAQLDALEAAWAARPSPFPVVLAKEGAVVSVEG